MLLKQSTKVISTTTSTEYKVTNGQKEEIHYQLGELCALVMKVAESAIRGDCSQVSLQSV